MTKKKEKKQTAERQEQYNFDGIGIMSVENLSCEFNMPAAVKSKTITDENGNEIEVKAGLPPYQQRQTFVVDEYPGCPVNWMHGSSKASSYFVPIKEGHGMWLDFNRCENHNHNVAIVVSVQGVNSITGQKTDKLCLEKYKNQCPIHEIDFQQDRFCEKCKYSWPAQNYLANTGTPPGYFWLDGFRTPDGKVRQYIFSAEEARGVAANIIGKDRVFAIGMAFYLSKEPKPKPDIATFHRKSIAKPDSIQYATAAGLEDFDMMPDATLAKQGTTVSSYTGERASLSTRSVASGQRRVKRSMVKSKNYEVAAGAAINQEVHPDPQDIDYWADEPAGMIYVNYCDEETALKIIQQGKREEENEGFLSEIPVGN